MNKSKNISNQKMTLIKTVNRTIPSIILVLWLGLLLSYIFNSSFVLRFIFLPLVGGFITFLNLKTYKFTNIYKTAYSTVAIGLMIAVVYMLMGLAQDSSGLMCSGLFGESTSCLKHQSIQVMVIDYVLAIPVILLYLVSTIFQFTKYPINENIKTLPIETGLIAFVGVVGFITGFINFSVQ